MQPVEFIKKRLQETGAAFGFIFRPRKLRKAQKAQKEDLANETLGCGFRINHRIHRSLLTYFISTVIALPPIFNPLRLF